MYMYVCMYVCILEKIISHLTGIRNYYLAEKWFGKECLTRQSQTDRPKKLARVSLDLFQSFEYTKYPKIELINKNFFCESEFHA